MKILDLENQDTHICSNCDAEFSVTQFYEEAEDEISFCPFCGSELDYEDNDDDIDEEIDDDIL